MIQFKKLRLNGFKSFVEKTELDIGPGLTGIVGPNGCGKSNLVEALRWSMGETSSKRMRGGSGSMEDVIFNGTEKRPARNFAEVTVLLDNTAHTAPSMFNEMEEIEVVRRIEREKGSDYKIGGKTVRARDVQLLYADLHAGAGSPLGTLAEMFPERVWAALGSGEALNEHVTGDEWPPKEQRDERLRASADVMRRLLSGEQVDAEGLVRVHRARVWSLPETPPPLLAAGISTATAAEVASWADGLITVGADAQATAQTRKAYRDAGGRGDLLLQIHISLERSEEDALAAAREQWAQATVPPQLMWELSEPEQFEAHADPTDEKLRAAVVVGSEAEDVADRIAAVAEGFDGVFLHQVGRDQARFLDRCERELLPLLRERL